VKNAGRKSTGLARLGPIRTTASASYPFSPANVTVRSPKELTRITSGLLASRSLEEVSMLKARTHFEQVPLEVVRKIIEEQLRREKTVGQSQVTNKDVLNNLADAVPELLILRR